MGEIRIQDDQVDVEKIMNKIKAEIRKRKRAGVYPKELEENLSIDIASIDQPDIKLSDDPKVLLSHMNAEWAIYTDQPLESDRPLIGPLVVLLKKVIRRAIGWYVNSIVSQMVIFNRSVVQAVNWSFNEIAGSKAELARLTAEVKKMSEILETLAEIDVAARLGRLERRTDKSLALETASPRLKKDKKELAHKEERFDYFIFEHKFRGASELIGERQAPFLKYFKGSENVLDVGCGRGEFLEGLKEMGVPAYGIDLDQDMILQCREKGLKVIKAEALSHLEDLPNSSLGGIFLGQVIEHLEPDQLMRLAKLSFDKLKSGSYFIAETVNPQCLSVFAGSFYLDPSHIRPVHPGTMKFILNSLGFRDIKVELMSPYPEEGKLHQLTVPSSLSDQEREQFEKININIRKLNDLLYGYQDYAVVARKGN